MLELDFFGDVMGLYEQDETGSVTFWAGAPAVDPIKHGQVIKPGRYMSQKAREEAQVVMHYDRKAFMATLLSLCDLLTDEECRKIENMLFRKILERRDWYVHNHRPHEEHTETDR